METPSAVAPAPAAANARGEPARCRCCGHAAAMVPFPITTGRLHVDPIRTEGTYRVARWRWSDLRVHDYRICARCEGLRRAGVATLVALGVMWAAVLMVLGAEAPRFAFRWIDRLPFTAWAVAFTLSFAAAMVTVLWLHPGYRLRKAAVDERTADYAHLRPELRPRFATMNRHGV